jgi:hypothetical protein
MVMTISKENSLWVFTDTLLENYTSSAGTDNAAYDDLPGYHLLAARNLIATDD